ncbi:hypothetical protein K3495_g16309, partial [Podosphaera aphanis]
LANRCRESSFDDIIAECLQWTSDVGSKSSAKQNLKLTCNYCHKIGHKEIECKKKIRDRDGNHKGNGDKNQKKILSLNKSSENLEYQLDTGADFHVIPNVNDFSTYSKSPQTVFVAGGSQISTSGKGDLLFPTSDGKTEILKGAVHLPLQKNRILSTSQLESQGYSLYWPPKYGDVELIRPNGTKCATFQRESGRLIWNPKIITDLSNPQIHLIKRDWHSILGHPGQKAQDAVLKLVGIKDYKPPENCETCTKSKISKSKGHSSLKHSASFAEAIHLDLVGGQKSLAPTTTDKSIPIATWFLLAVD